MAQRADVVITGVTGRIGGMVARQLAAAGTPVRMIARDPSRAPQLAGAEVLEAAYADRAAATAAMQGARTVFMVSASEAPDRVAEHTTFVDAAVAAGVRHIVYLSFFGAAPDATFTLGRDHWATEQYIRATGMEYTFLRDNLYADFLPKMVGDDGVLRGPAEDGRVAAVAQADVADAATAVLQNPAAHIGATYGLSGPEALRLREVADTLTRVTGRTTTYQPETIEEAYASRAVYGAPQWQVDAWVSTYTSIARGELEEVTDVIQTLTGHAPMRFEEVLRRSLKA
jgi:NAD(P)H dehydrogenase (quinone)